LKKKICSSGGAVIVNNEIIYKRPISNESKKEIMEFLDDRGVIYNLECNDYLWTKKGEKEIQMRLFPIPEKGTVPDKEYEKALERRKEISAGRREIENPYDLDVNKIHWYEAEILYDGKSFPSSYDEINKKFGEKYNVVPLSLSKTFAGGEITEKGIEKSAGMKVVLKHFNISEDDVYAIGDDFNDREMLSFAKHPIAMAHTPQEIKDLCEYITGEFEEDGFYNAMKHFQLF